MRRSVVVRLIIFGVLLAFMPTMVFFRWWKKSLTGYHYCDAPGTNIPLPDEVNGQQGFNVGVSYDGKRIVVAGNHIIPQEIMEGKREVALRMWVLKYSLFVASTEDYDFKPIIYHNRRPGLVADIAFSPTNPGLIAFIAVEVPVTMPETMKELVELSKDPIKRHKLADEYAEAYCLKDQRIVVYTMDVNSNKPPKELCVLDITPGLSPKEMNFENRLRGEKATHTMTWSSDGKTVFVSNRRSIWSVDIIGNKSPFYTFDDLIIWSNIFCYPNGDVLFLSGSVKDTGLLNLHLTQLNKEGTEISRHAVSSFYPGTYYFDEPLYALLDGSTLAITGNRSDMHDALLRVVSFPPFTDDWKARSKKYSFHDPNDVQYYYQPKAILQETKELLLVKLRTRRVLLSNEEMNEIKLKPDGGTPKDVMEKDKFEKIQPPPWTLENSAAPWVELRKVKIG